MLRDVSIHHIKRAVQTMQYFNYKNIVYEKSI